MCFYRISCRLFQRRCRRWESQALIVSPQTNILNLSELQLNSYSNTDSPRGVGEAVSLLKFSFVKNDGNR